MADNREIQEIARDGTFYGKAFTVVIGQPSAGQPFVKEVHIEGLPVIKSPDHDPVETFDEAVAVGYQIACGVIGADY